MYYRVATARCVFAMSPSLRRNSCHAAEENWGGGGERFFRRLSSAPLVMPKPWKRCDHRAYAGGDVLPATQSSSLPSSTSLSSFVSIILPGVTHRLRRTHTRHTHTHTHERRETNAYAHENADRHTNGDTHCRDTGSHTLAHADMHTTQLSMSKACLEFSITSLLYSSVTDSITTHTHTHTHSHTHTHTHTSHIGSLFPENPSRCDLVGSLRTRQFIFLPLSCHPPFQILHSQILPSSSIPPSLLLSRLLSCFLTFSIWSYFVLLLLPLNVSLCLYFRLSICLSVCLSVSIENLYVMNRWKTAHPTIAIYNRCVCIAFIKTSIQSLIVLLSNKYI